MASKAKNALNPNLALLERRRALGTLCALGAAGLAGRLSGAITPARAAAAASCSLSPELTEGPYWVDEGLKRYDITGGSTLVAIANAVPLYLQINLVDANCQALSGVQVDLWHCHAAGSYSDENAASNGASTLGQTWLRGYRVTSEAGVAQFKTIYPGWYRGRTTHIHVRARYYDSQGNATYNWTTQLFFDDTTSDAVFASAPYVARSSTDVYNSTDNIYVSGGAKTLLSLSKGLDGSYTGTATLALSLATSADEVWQDGFE
jgi:protocatechuate 3,4-dioxygenase beta subunit